MDGGIRSVAPPRAPGRTPSRARRAPAAGSLFALALLLAALPASAQRGPDAVPGPEAPLIRAGGHGDLPPFEFLDDDGQARGFSVDLLREVAAAAGLRVEVTLGAWDRVYDDTKGGRMDLIVGMHDTPERREHFAFSGSYMDLPYDVFTRPHVAGIRALEDLAGRRVIVMRRSMGHRLADRVGAVAVPRENPREVMLALDEGVADLALLARYPGLWIASELDLEGLAPVGLDIGPSQYAFATAKENAALVEALDRGLDEVKATGRYRQIWDRWFNVRKSPGLDPWGVARYSAWVLGPVALLLLLWALWTRSLRREVAARTREFRQELAQRQAAQEALAREREQLAVTLRSIADAVLTVDPEGRVVLVNRGAEALFGWQPGEAVGRPLDEALPLEDEVTGRPPDAVRRCLEGQASAEMRRAAVFRAPDGRVRLVTGSAGALRDRSGALQGAVLVLRDIGERRRIDEELARSDRLESLGVLAGGIAHDFNNVLAAILGNLSLARAPMPGVDTDACLLRAEEAADRARHLTGQLLTFARGGALRKRVEDLGALLRESAGFILTGTASRADVRLPPDLWPCEVDAGQLVQVVHNLTLNGAQAMPGGGTVTWEARNETLEEGNPWALPPGAYVRLSVTDHGTGIPRENLARVFEPFFTTKSRGTGLGLSVCHSIVTRHGGRIEAESEPGRGTTFTLLLPAAPGGRTAPAPAEDGPPVPGTGRILVMDDEDLLRETLVSQLAHLGYEVQAVPDGQAALAAWRSARDEGRPFDAVVLDLTVPGGMGGQETLDHLRRVDPSVVALVITGYCNDPVTADFRQAGFAGAVLKPFSMRQLSLALEDALRGSGEGKEPRDQ